MDALEQAGAVTHVQTAPTSASLRDDGASEDVPKRQKYEVIPRRQAGSGQERPSTPPQGRDPEHSARDRQEEGQLYELRESTIERSESDHYDITGGRRVWVGAKTLRRLEFTIRKLDAHLRARM